MARLAIDLAPELHRVIKGEASLRGVSIRDFVLSALHEQIQKSHKPSKSAKHDCPLCAVLEGKSLGKRSRKAIEAPLTHANNRHYVFEDELPHALKVK